MDINGTTGPDNLQGTDQDDSLYGLAGDDVLSGGGGDDYLVGGPGNDRIDGGANGTYGDRIAFPPGADAVDVDLTAGTASDGQGGVDTVVNVEHIVGTPFADKLKGNAAMNFFQPRGGSDVVDGAGGRDTVMYEDAGSGVNIDLLAGFASGSSIGTATLTSIEAVNGSNFDDMIQLANVAGYAFGRGGNDILTGGSAADSFFGGSGDDILNGGAGSDTADYSAPGITNEPPPTG